MNTEHAELTTLSGWRIERHATVGSTNDLAKARARAGDLGRLAIVADEQTSGRGRMGRSWVAPPRSSLLVSLLVRPGAAGGRAALRDSERIDPSTPATHIQLEPMLSGEHAYVMTMLAAVALCEAIEAVVPIQAVLKWPNDLMLSGSDGRLRKAAGILAEVDIRSGLVAWVVLGFGVNLTWHPSGVIDGRDLAQHATSLYAAAGLDRMDIAMDGAAERTAILHALLKRVSAWDATLGDSGATELSSIWRSRLSTIGQQVAIQLPDRVVEGLAEDVEPSGALRVRDRAGQLQIVTTGEVRA